MNEWKIEDAIADLKTSHARTTKGVWGKGKTTHETVARSVDKPPYKIADFHHADDAQFLDLAHALIPSVIERLESLEKDAARYRWLRQSHWDCFEENWLSMNGVYDYDGCVERGLDLAIDWHMQANKGE